MATRTLPVGDPGTPSDGERDQSHPGRRPPDSQLRHQTDALTGGDQGEHGGEVVRVMTHGRAEAGQFTRVQGHRVTERARAAHDPVRVAYRAHRVAGEVPVRPDGQVDRLLQQWHRVQGRARLDGHDVVVVHERHVEAAVAQRVGHRDRVQLGDHQVERGMVTAERDQGGQQQGTHRTGVRADAYRAAEPAPRGDESRVGRLQRGEDDLGVPDQRHPGGGQGDPPTGPLQQRHAGLALQRGELLGHGGRRLGVRLGHGGDGAEVGKIPQQAQATDVKHQFSLRIR